MDAGPPYRSFVGLPGGSSSELYPAFASQNTFGMALSDGHGSESDTFNTVWVYDSDAFPFYDGEVFHQNHCNFFQSEGMPYPNAYTIDLWHLFQRDGRYAPTGCPESGSHVRCGAWG